MLAALFLLLLILPTAALASGGALLPIEGDDAAASRMATGLVLSELSMSADWGAVALFRKEVAPDCWDSVACQARLCRDEGFEHVLSGKLMEQKGGNYTLQLRWFDSNEGAFVRAVDRPVGGFAEMALNIPQTTRVLLSEEAEIQETLAELESLEGESEGDAAVEEGADEFDPLAGSIDDFDDLAGDLEEDLGDDGGWSAEEEVEEDLSGIEDNFLDEEVPEERTVGRRNQAPTFYDDEDGEERRVMRERDREEGTGELFGFEIGSPKEEETDDARVSTAGTLGLFDDASDVEDDGAGAEGDSSETTNILATDDEEYLAGEGTDEGLDEAPTRDRYARNLNTVDEARKGLRRSSPTLGKVETRGFVRLQAGYRGFYLLGSGSQILVAGGVRVFKGLAVGAELGAWMFRWDMDPDRGFQDWRTYYSVPFALGATYTLGKRRVRPWVGVDLLFVSYNGAKSVGGVHTAVGPRVRLGADLQFSDRVGFFVQMDTGFTVADEAEITTPRAHELIGFEKNLPQVRGPLPRSGGFFGLGVGLVIHI